MKLDIDKAIDIWRTDKGYRVINSYLIDSSSRNDYIYHQDNNKAIKHEGNIYNTIDVINIIRENMKGSDAPKIYYRGGSEKSKGSFVKESFISVSTDEEQAQQFMDGDCCLYKITVEPSVKRYKTGIEDEILLENGLYWKYIGKEGKYHLINITQKKPILEQPIVEQSMDDSVASKFNPHNLSENDLNSYLELYRDECSLLDIEQTPEGFLDYLERFNKKISIEKAKEMIKTGGKKSKKNKKTLRRKRRNGKKRTFRKKSK